MKRCVICRRLNIDETENCSRCGHRLTAMAISLGMKIAWGGFAIAMLAALVMWALSVSGIMGIYPFGLIVLGIGALSILIGLFSYQV